MYHYQVMRPGRSGQAGRNGILHLGPLREILVISVAAGLVLAALWQFDSESILPLSPKDPQALSGTVHPIRKVDFDRDRQSLIVYAWPDEVSEVNFESGVSTRRQVPRQVVSAATSGVNSTTIMLTQSMGARPVQFEVHIVRGDELVLSEELPLTFNYLADARISDNGQIAMVITDDGTAFCWDLAPSTPQYWTMKLKLSAFSNSLSPDGRSLFISGGTGRAAICDTRTGEIKVDFPDIPLCSRTATWSADGQRIAVSNQEGDLHVFQAATGERVLQQKLNFLFARSLALSADGNLLAVCGFDKQIYVWNLSRPTDAPRTLEGDASVAHSLVFVRADEMLVSGGDDGSLRDWSMTTYKQVRRFR